MLADRVGMVEGVCEDLTRGHVPNVFGELGWKAEWQHKRKSLVTRTVIETLVTCAVVGYFRRKTTKS